MKIFVTGGDKSFTEYEKLGKGFIVVWATIDPTAGRKGMRGFVVEGGTPGVKITTKAFGKDRRLPITNRYRPEIR